MSVLELQRLLRVECEPRTVVAIDPSKRHFVSTLEDGTVYQWSVRRGQYEILRGHMRKATCVVFSPRSDLLCTGSYDHTLRLWNVADSECMATLEGHDDEITCAAFDSHGRMLCSGSADQSLKLWRVMDGRSMRAYKGLSATATSVAFRPVGADGKGGSGQGSLVCGGEDGIMWLLDAAKAGRPKRLKGHTGAVRKLLFHPLQPNLLISCSDGILRTWSTETAQCLQVINTDCKKLLDYGLIPSTGNLLLVTLCTVPQISKPRTQQVARGIFGFLANSAGNDSLRDKMKAEDAKVALTLVLVSFDSETGSFSQTLDVESAPLETKDLPHNVVLAPDCEALLCASHRRVSMYDVKCHAKHRSTDAGLNDVCITILPAGGTNSEGALTSEDASVNETSRASSDISEEDGVRPGLASLVGLDGPRNQNGSRRKVSTCAGGVFSDEEQGRKEIFSELHDGGTLENRLHDRQHTGKAHVPSFHKTPTEPQRSATYEDEGSDDDDARVTASVGWFDKMALEAGRRPPYSESQSGVQGVLAIGQTQQHPRAVRNWCGKAGVQQQRVASTDSDDASVAGPEAMV